MDSEATANELEQYALLARHFGAIDANPLWRKAKKIFIPENNLGLEASHMDTLVSRYSPPRGAANNDAREFRILTHASHTQVRRFNNVESYWETDKRVGIRMTNDLKRNYQMFMVHSL